MWTRQSHVLAPMTEANIGPKGRKILWNAALESYHKYLKRMVSGEPLLYYPYCTIPFRVNTDGSDEQLCAVIS